MKDKDSRNVDRIVRFRSSTDPDQPAIPSASNQGSQDRLITSLVFAFTDGAIVTNDA